MIAAYAARDVEDAVPYDLYFGLFLHAGISRGEPSCGLQAIVWV